VELLTYAVWSTPFEALVEAQRLAQEDEAGGRGAIEN
jgi:hypothetical protein